VKYLLDTHLLLWAAGMPEKLSRQARKLINDEENEMIFSAASLWEVSIKRRLGRKDFSIDERVLRRALLDNGYLELSITGDHVVGVGDLPLLHKDPFDRILVAQAHAEGVTLVTTDPQVAAYSAAVRKV
jgi:PIN domain nuclease of toxin-antitoxin system